MMKWIYTAMIRPIMSYACVSWAGGLNKKHLVRKLTEVQRLACLMISSVFPGIPTGALEILLNITPIEEFLLAEVGSRTQGSRPRTPKKSEAKAKDSLFEDRHSRGQGQECSRPRPRTQAQVLSKKKGLSKNFSCDLHKKTLSKKFFKRSTKF